MESFWVQSLWSLNDVETVLQALVTSQLDHLTQVTSAVKHAQSCTVDQDHPPTTSLVSLDFSFFQVWCFKRLLHSAVTNKRVTRRHERLKCVQETGSAQTRGNRQ